MMKPRYVLATTILSLINGETLRNLAAEESTAVTLMDVAVDTIAPLPNGIRSISTPVYNAAFDDEKVYFAAQLEDRQTYIYEFSPGVKEVRPLFTEPVQLLDLEGKLSMMEKTHFSVMGADLSSQGDLCLAVGDRDVMTCINLDSDTNAVVHEVEIKDIVDVTFDPNEEDVIYCARGKRTGVFTDGKDGSIEKIHFLQDSEVHLKTLVQGIGPIRNVAALHNGELMLTQRDQTMTLDLRTLGTKRLPAPVGEDGSVWSPGAISKWSSHAGITLMTAQQEQKQSWLATNPIFSQLDHIVGKMLFRASRKPVSSVLENAGNVTLMVERVSDDNKEPNIAVCVFPAPYEEVAEAPLAAAARGSRGPSKKKRESRAQMAGIVHRGDMLYMIPADYSSILAVNDSSMREVLGLKK